jgi:hypothetical protein
MAERFEERLRRAVRVARKSPVITFGAGVGPNFVAIAPDKADALADLVEAVDKQRKAEHDMLSVVPIGAHGSVESRLMREWIGAGVDVEIARERLDALSGPGGEG